MAFAVSACVTPEADVPFGTGESDLTFEAVGGRRPYPSPLTGSGWHPLVSLG